MKNITACLRGLKRQFSGLPPVRNIAFLNANWHNRFTTHTTIDFGLELCSRAEFAEEEIDGRTFRRRFPWVATRIRGHVYRMKTTEPWDVLVISYDLSQHEMLKRFGLDAENPGWEFLATEEISQKTAALARLLEQTCLPGITDRIDLLALDLLRLTLLENRENAQSPEETAVRQIASCFSACVYEKLDLAEIIRRHNLSTRSFFRHWKRLYEISPADFIMQKKMEEACRLLQESSLRVYEIANRLRFADCSHFCRVFRQWNHVSPQDYRRDGESGKYAGGVPPGGTK